MNELITANHPQLIHLCQLYHVRRLELFGSAVRSQAEAEIGDLDFLVDFADLEETGYAQTYFGLLESLQNLFNKPVDLVMLSGRQKSISIAEHRKESDGAICGLKQRVSI